MAHAAKPEGTWEASDVCILSCIFFSIFFLIDRHYLAIYFYRLINILHIKQLIA